MNGNRPIVSFVVFVAILAISKDAQAAIKPVTIGGACTPGLTVVSPDPVQPKSGDTIKWTNSTACTVKVVVPAHDGLLEKTYVIPPGGTATSDVFSFATTYSYQVKNTSDTVLVNGTIKVGFIGSGVPIMSTPALAVLVLLTLASGVLLLRRYQS